MTLALKLTNSAALTIVTQTPVASERLKPNVESGGSKGKLEGWNATTGEWVCPADGVYLAKYSVGYPEPEDGGSQATAAAAFVSDAPITPSIRQDKQLPEGFFHSFDGVVFGFIEKGQKLYLDFTNATGKDIEVGVSGILVQIQRLSTVVV